MEKKKKYSAKALAIFKQEGLRMSLEELAEKMGVAKKTLYNHFSSKDELLMVCVHNLFSDLHRAIEVLTDEKRDAITNMIAAFSAMNTFFYFLSPLFMNDLKKLYPEMANIGHTEGLGRFSEKIAGNIEKGIKEGLYLADLEPKMTSQYITYSIFGFYIHSVMSTNEFAASNYFETLAMYNLRALVTEKGRGLLINNSLI